MDVSIAVSLIRGHMGTVVERAVNGAVETVLAEMLKVVGVKFEELKAQVATLKRDMAALQKEKASKEKEYDKVRAMLRYTELKLKYYRQGVEEEMNQRTTSSSLVRIHQTSFPPSQRGSAAASPTEAALTSWSRTPLEGAAARTGQGCSSPQSRSRPAARVRCQPDVGVVSSDLSDLLLSVDRLPVSLSLNTPVEALETSTECSAAAQRKEEEEEEEDDCEWTISLQDQTESLDCAPPPAPPLAPPLAPALEPGQNSALGPLSPGRSTQADSSTLPCDAPQVKQEEAQQQEEEEEEEEEEVICIKEEPEEEQEVMATLLLDCQMQQGHIPGFQGQRSAVDWPGPPGSQRNHNDHTFNSAGPSSYPMPQLAATHTSTLSSFPGVPPRQAMRPWTKDLSLYEEYKLRRNELRRRSLNRRREMEKTLPQPLLADLVRERREKTRLRVARWRAKRKLQACLEAQATGGAAGSSLQPGLTISSQHQQLRAARGTLGNPQHDLGVSASSSGDQPRRSSAMPQCSSFLNNMSSTNSYSTSLPFITPSSSSSLLLGGHNMTEHANQHTVTSSSSHPHISLSQQSLSLTDADIFQ